MTNTSMCLLRDRALCGLIRVVAIASGALLLLFFVLLSGSSHAGTIVDLTSAGSSGAINGAIFEQINPRSTGTGVIDSFVQQSPQGNGTTSEAYNTTKNNTLDNGPSDNFNHSVLLGDVPIQQRSGEPYRAFILDINESAGLGNEFLSLDDVQIFVGGTANSNVTSFTGGVLDHDGALVYRMDTGMDNWVALNYSLNSGSGSGDMLLLVPNSSFAGFGSGEVVTLYSQFGMQGVNPTGFTGNFGASAGFEEWAMSPIPEPATVVLLLGAGLSLVALRRRR